MGKTGRGLRETERKRNGPEMKKKLFFSSKSAVLSRFFSFYLKNGT